MTSDTASAPAGMLLGYARDTGGGGGRESRDLDSQIDVLTAAGVDARRVYSDSAAPGADPTTPPRSGLAALLDYARPGDTVVVVGIDRLGRTTPEVLSTARTLADHHLGLRSLREGVDTDDPAGNMIVGVLASLSRLDEESGPDRRRITQRAGHGGRSSIGRPRALTSDQVALAERMRANGDPVPAIAEALGVSRATLYRTLAETRSTR